MATSLSGPCMTAGGADDGRGVEEEMMALAGRDGGGGGDGVTVRSAACRSVSLTWSKWCSLVRLLDEVMLVVRNDVK